MTGREPTLPALQIQLLGGFRVWIGPNEVPDTTWRRRKAASLLKLLALAPERRLHREEAMEWLWPDLEPEGASNNLHRTLHIVRHALEPNLAAGNLSAYVCLQGDLLSLCPTGSAHIDVEDFRAAAATAQQKRDPGLYRAALALYTGDLLPEDRFEDWASGCREELRRTYLDLLRDLARLSEERGEQRVAIEILQRLIASEPAEEEAHAALMRLFALTGQRQRAVQQYQLLRASLQREVEADPDEANTRLYEDIVAGRFPPAEPSPSPSAAGRGGSTGTSAATGSEELNGRVDASPATNLPGELNSFVGRDEERKEVRLLLSQTRMLTLTGAGGCGKTRLALRVASDLLGTYKDGLWLVELAALADPRLVPQTVAAALGVREEPDRPIAETLANHLRSQNALLILDNCEHLVDACSRLADALLRACPSLGILATSRQALGIPGEVVWRVPSLAAPDPARLPPLEDLARYDAVQLFLERAQASRAGFALTPGNAASIARVCHRLDGIPLAIELATVRVKVLTPEQIAARLDNCFVLLSGGSRAALPRQQTLRATIDWSYELLSATEQAVFRRLSVFAGGWTVEAAEEVCAGGSVAEHQMLDVLSELIDQSLVIAEQKDEQLRFRMLEMVRQYAAEKLLEAGDAEATRARHARCYLALAERAEPELTGREQTAWFQRLEAEHDNLRAALRWLLEHDVEHALRLSGALWRFWWVRSYLSEGRRWFEEVLTRGVGAAPGIRSKVLRGAGALAINQGDYSRAAELLGESAEICRQTGDRVGLASALNNMGNAASAQSDYKRAATCYAESLSLYRELQDNAGIVRAINNLALAAYFQTDYEEAAARYEEGLALSRDMGDTDSIARMLSNLGLAVLEGGDRARAAGLLAEGLALFQELGNAYSIAWCLEGLARVASAQKQAERAIRLFAAAEARRDAIGATLLPMEIDKHESYLAAARRALQPKAFDGIWAEGRAMSKEQAVAYALAQEPCAEAGGVSSVLSRRERDVALLIARGLTNQQIAAQLGMSVRTVGTHVTNILKKLGCTSRAEVVKRATERELLEATAG